MKLFIGNKNYSSWSMRPWVAMRQASLEFEERMVRFDSFAPGSEFKRRLAGLSPTGKVPVLIAGIEGREQAIWDTLAIVEHLAERFPDRRLWPSSAGARARARSVTAEMHSGFQALRSCFPMNIEADLPEVGRRLLVERGDAAEDLARLGRLWNDCLSASGGPFLFGEFGIADAFFAPVVMRARTYRLPLDASAQAYADEIVKTPAVTSWIEGALAERDFLPFEEPYRTSPAPRHRENG
jgi:glutathione S-transferase